MKIIDRSDSKQAAAPGSLSKALGRFIPSSNKPDTSALTVLTSSLERLLDDHYVLIKNLAIEEVQLEIPAILVGPTGLIVFYTSEVAGVFRCQGDSWEQLKNQSHRYVTARPNPVKLVLEMTSTLRTFLAKRQVECKQIEPIIFLANPEIHVDAIKPAARMVLPDTLERFISGVFHQDVINDRTFIRTALAGLMDVSEESKVNNIHEFQDGFALKDLTGVKSERWKPFPNLPHEEPIIAQRVSFTRRQWAMLMLLILTNIVVLTTLVVFVMSAG